MLTHLDLFSGIGACSLAAHWAGFQTVAFVEIEPFCQKVLAKNFPGVEILGDIREVDFTRFLGVDLVSGGSPCQDISGANPKGNGLDGSRSNLFFEFIRAMDETKARFALFENVRNLSSRGLDRVCASMESVGYDVWPTLLSAAAAGAPIVRERFILLAVSKSFSRLQTHQKNVSERGPTAARENSRIAASGLSRREQSSSYWSVPFTGAIGVDAGFTDRVDRVRALGNTNPPQLYYPFLKFISDTLRNREAAA